MVVSDGALGKGCPAPSPDEFFGVHARRVYRNGICRQLKTAGLSFVEEQRRESVSFRGRLRAAEESGRAGLSVRPTDRFLGAKEMRLGMTRFAAPFVV